MIYKEELKEIIDMAHNLEELGASAFISYYAPGIIHVKVYMFEKREYKKIPGINYGYTPLIEETIVYPTAEELRNLMDTLNDLKSKLEKERLYEEYK